MSQSSLWQAQTDNNDFAELCNALYQREIKLLAKGDFSNAQAVQQRLQSLSHYITRTAHSMTQVIAQAKSPLQLDCQNASWSAKQSKQMPLAGQGTCEENKQANKEVFTWYLAGNINVGLVVPVQMGQHIMLDCIDRLDLEGHRLRTNVGGWFNLAHESSANTEIFEHVTSNYRLLKPNKKVMLAACAGHCWQGNSKLMPTIPSLRELLLSCSINWQNFKKTSLL